MQRLYSTPAAAVAPPRLYLDSETWIEPARKPPTVEQLSSLRAVPTGMYQAMQSASRLSKAAHTRQNFTSKTDKRGKITSKRNPSRLAKEAQITSKMFDALGRRPMPNNGLNLEQTIQLELQFSTQTFLAANGTAGATTYATYVCSLSQFAGASSLTAVFDQYKIDQIEAWLVTSTPNSASAYPVFTTAVDLDDGNMPTTVGQVQDRLGAIQSNGPGGHYHKWKPHVAVDLYSGTFTSFGNMPAGWIDVASPGVQHYGLKAAATSDGNAINYDLTVRAVISFRAPVIS